MKSLGRGELKVRCIAVFVGLLVLSGCSVGEVVLQKDKAEVQVRALAGFTMLSSVVADAKSVVLNLCNRKQPIGSASARLALHPLVKLTDLDALAEFGQGGLWVVAETQGHHSG